MYWFRQHWQTVLRRVLVTEGLKPVAAIDVALFRSRSIPWRTSRLLGHAGKVHITVLCCSNLGDHCSHLRYTVYTFRNKMSEILLTSVYCAHHAYHDTKNITARWPQGVKAKEWETTNTGVCPCTRSVQYYTGTREAALLEFTCWQWIIHVARRIRRPEYVMDILLDD